MSKKAFSYARFSTSEQEDGRSQKRQEEACLAFCKRHRLTLDERTFTDLGVSGFKGANARGGELSLFLELVREGRVPKGSTLIVENMDRLSRLPVHQANKIIMDIVQAGVNIATTSPESLYTLANIGDVGTWIPLQVAQCLARQESEKKSVRLADAWASKRQALANGTKMSKYGPAWLELSADRKTWIVIEEKAAIVRNIFKWSAEGLGSNAISGLLNKSHPEGLKVPKKGKKKSKGWQPSYVNVILRSRSVLGEFQPHTGTPAKKGGIKSTRKPYGEPIQGYFPAVVTEADFILANDAIDKRHAAGSGGRVTGTPNLFNGLLVDAFDGQSMVCNASHGRKILVSSGAIRKLPGSVFRTIGYEVFEKAILSRLAELKPADLLPAAVPVEDAVAEFTAKLVVVNRKIETLNKHAAAADDVTVFLPLIDDLARQRKEIIAGLEKAKTEATTRASDTLGESKSLLRLLEDETNGERDELRRRLRGCLRRLIDKAYVVIVANGRDRMAAVQIRFAGTGTPESGLRRNYIIISRPGGAWWVSSITNEIAAELHFSTGVNWRVTEYDLTNPQDVAEQESSLLAWPKDLIDDFLRVKK